MEALIQCQPAWKSWRKHPFAMLLCLSKCQYCLLLSGPFHKNDSQERRGALLSIWCLPKPHSQVWFNGCSHGQADWTAWRGDVPASDLPGGLQRKVDNHGEIPARLACIHSFRLVKVKTLFKEFTGADMPTNPEQAQHFYALCALFMPSNLMRNLHHTC